MVIKHAQPNELRNLLSILQRACKNDRLFVTFTKKKYNYIIILKLLHEQGFIQSFEEKGNFLIIRLKQTHWKTRNRPIKSIQKITSVFHYKKKHTINAKNIKKIYKNKGSSFFYIFSTDQNIMSNRKAAQASIGGIPLILVK